MHPSDERYLQDLESLIMGKYPSCGEIVKARITESSKTVICQECGNRISKESLLNPEVDS